MVEESPTEQTHLLAQQATSEHPYPVQNVKEVAIVQSNYKLELQPQHITQNAGVFSSVMNVVNAAVGAGVLALPYAFKCTGLVLGLLMLLFIVMMTLYSCTLLARCIEKTGLVSYEKLSEFAFGKWAGYSMKGVIILMTFGSAVAYVVVIGDTIPPVLQQLERYGVPWFFYNRTTVSAVVLIAIILPLCFLKDINSLRYPSMLAFLSVWYLIALVVIYRIIKPSEHLKEPDNPLVLFNWDWKVFLAFPILIFAYNCQILLFPILAELKDRTMTRMFSVISIGVFLYALMYLIISVVGYLSFYGRTLRNILFNFENGDIAAMIGRLAIGGNVTLGFPLQIYACRDTVNRTFFPKSKFSWERHIFLALLLCGGSYALGTLIPIITVIFGFLGASTGLIVMFIAPAMLYLKIIVYDGHKRWNSWRAWMQAICPGITFILGVILGIVCTGVVILEYITGME